MKKRGGGKWEKRTISFLGSAPSGNLRLPWPCIINYLGRPISLYNTPARKIGGAINPSGPREAPYTRLGPVADTGGGGVITPPCS